MTAADGHLLFGLLALQNGIINQGQLVATFQAWTLDKSKSLADHMEIRGDLTGARRALLEALAEVHLEAHGGDVEKSLAAVSAGKSTRGDLEQIGAPEINASLGLVGTAGGSTEDGDPDRTPSYSVGAATSDGQRFRVLRPHARGGLGAVFVALDGELRREVALKQILDAHADDPVSRQRFLLEAEVTGGLEHPGIVPVYSLGTYEGGRPYYAMRFIRGDSLKEAIEYFHADESSKEYLGRRSLELRKLLRRFTDVCNAIGYAHSRGVLHRDIKPGNIIVGRYGETLVVDWDLAKATGQSDPMSGERTLLPSSASGSAETLPGSALGTPAYMSPEQAEGDVEHLGPPSDVYSLGATLYCLLTGRPPFTGDVVDIIRGVQRGDFRPPRRIDPSIDRALEAICLKAMALKPAERYPAPRALAEDVERWMADEPVSAWREPWLLRARRWGRRNRTAVAAAAVAVLAGLIGLGAVAAVQARSNAALRNANRAKDQALAETQRAQALTEAALEQSETDRHRAEAAEKTARSEADKAKAITDFLANDLLSQAEPEHNAAENRVTLLEVLDRAAAKVGDHFTGQPEVEDALRRTIARTYHSLASWEKAERQWRAVLEAASRHHGGDSREVLTALGHLAHILRHRGGMNAKVLAMAKSSSDALARLVGPAHDDTLLARTDLAAAYQSSGRTAEAIDLLESMLKLSESRLGPGHNATLGIRNNLASSYLAAGRTAEAIMLLEGMLKLCESKLGADHPSTLINRSNLAEAYRVAGRTAEAVALFEPTIKLMESKLGPEHATTLNAVHELGHTLESGRPAEAEALFRRALAGYRRREGPNGAVTIHLARELDSVLARTGRSAAAEAHYRKVLQKHGPAHPETLAARRDLGDALLNAGLLDGASTELHAVLADAIRVLGPDHRIALVTRRHLAWLRYRRQEHDRALAESRQLLADERRALGESDAETIQTLRNAIQIGCEANRSELALELCRIWAGPLDQGTAIQLDQYGADLLRRKEPARAESLLRESFKIRERLAEEWSRFNTMSLLGESLQAQKQYARAEPWLLKGYGGMKAREQQIPKPSRSRLTEAGGRIVALYDAWGRPEEAARLRAKLAAPTGELPAEVFAP